ncbi:MAG: hypothetical protein JSW55_06185 [Chloroflexota bacterium]|nr:MAG: hypothetical protein JSW55_06185 [Chloroflexota bacterium]
MNAGPSRAGLLTTLILAVYLLAGCQDDPEPLPTAAAALPSIAPPTAGPGSPTATVPATWTVPAGGLPSFPSPAGLPSFTPAPSNTPWSTFTPTASATATPSDTPEATATASPTAPPEGGVNLLPNPSFEDSWHHQSGVPELQVPDGWQLEWHEGRNWLDSDPWNRFVRPETRVLTSDFLPADERELFIWDGNQTVKIFKREGALSFRLTTDVFLEAGSYLFSINVFPDMIDSYSENGSKKWAPDNLSAQLRFIVDPPSEEWHFPTFGEKNHYQYAFFVEQPKTIRLGVHFVGRWAILNNGWFMDDWSLVQLSPAS